MILSGHQQCLKLGECIHVSGLTLNTLCTLKYRNNLTKLKGRKCSLRTHLSHPIGGHNHRTYGALVSPTLVLKTFIVLARYAGEDCEYDKQCTHGGKLDASCILKPEASDTDSTICVCDEGTFSHEGNCLFRKFK